jgi:hypothetical protein
MSFWFLVMAVLGFVGIPAALGAGILWLSGSWEVVDDRHVIDRLERRGFFSWHFAFLFGNSTRRLTYRRDSRGRFRKIWRE